MPMKPKSPTLPLPLKVLLPLVSITTDFSRRSNGTINRSLLRYIEPKAKNPPRPVNGVKITDVMVDSSRHLWFRMYVHAPEDIIDDDKNDTSTTGTIYGDKNETGPNTTDGKNLPIVVFFHGGGFTFMSPDSILYDAVCRRIARYTHAVVVSVNYRCTPEYKYPCQYEDGFDMLKFLDRGENIEGFPKNVDVSRCFMAGDSAGANISHHVSRRWAEEVHEFTRLRIIGLISIQPFFGGEERTGSETRLEGVAPIVNIERCDWHWKVLLPEGSNRDHEAVNVFGHNAVDISKLKNFPNTLVVVGGYDPLQDWQRRYYEGLIKSGVNARLIEYPDAIHTFYLFPQLPESGLLINEIKNFIGKMC